VFRENKPSTQPSTLAIDTLPCKLVLGRQVSYPN